MLNKKDDIWAFISEKKWFGSLGISYSTMVNELGWQIIVNKFNSH